MRLDDLHFRAAFATDAGAIAALVRAAYAKWVPLIGREPRPMTADYALAVSLHDFDLAIAGGQLVGLIETERREDHLWIENVAVLPAAQGRGLGRLLLARAEDAARRFGLNSLRLLTSAAFAENIALYERVGYRITHTEPFMGGTTVYMARALGPE